MPFDYPLRLEIQRRLTAMFEEITIASGYQHDMAERVFRGRGVFGDETPIPAISILQVPIPLDQMPSPEDASESTGGWELMIQGFVADDKANPTDPAEVLMADAKKRLALEKKKTNWDKPEEGILGLGRFISTLHIGTGVVRPPDDLSAKAYFWLTITLTIAEDLAEPYASD